MSVSALEEKSATRTRPTLGDILDAGGKWLAARGVDEPRLSCEWLASALLGRRRTALPLGEIPPPTVVDRLRAGIRRLGAGEPVQYVTGEWDFRLLTLRTDSRALIPRPETEQLVELALADKTLWAKPSPLIYDVGTGTGAIALSLAYERPACRVVAVDCEEPALALARENAARCGLTGRVAFVGGRNCAGAAPASVDAIVSNPPYIASRVVDALPAKIRDHEPRTALDGGPDGLDVIRSLVHDAAIALVRGGSLFLEIGDEQGADVQALLEDAGFSGAHVFADFAGKPRFAVGRME